MRPIPHPWRVAVVVLALVSTVTFAVDPLGLARQGRHAELATLGTAALAPLLDAYPSADRETKTAILLALGALNIKSPAAKAVLDMGVDGESSAFQDLHRYALAVVDPAVRSRDLYEQVTAEGVALAPELGGHMYATLGIAYDACAERVAHAERWVRDLGAVDPERRYAAIVSLRIMTGASHAYHPWATEAARKGPRGAWRRWLRRLEDACRG